MKCDCCKRAITQAEADQAAEIARYGVTLCVPCAESIAAADYNEGGRPDTDSDSQE